MDDDLRLTGAESRGKVLREELNHFNTNDNQFLPNMRYARPDDYVKSKIEDKYAERSKPPFLKICNKK